MNPCKNNARCIDGMSGFRWTLKPMQYFCDCQAPYKGAHCDSKFFFVLFFKCSTNIFFFLPLVVFT